jgi:hypothetical protein
MQSIAVLSTAKRIRADRGTLPLMLSVAVTGWSVKYVIDLALVHTTGPELYGVAVAAVSVAAGALNLALLARPRIPLWAVAAVVSIWALVALGGVGGTIAHIVGPVAGHGPVDPRPRPIAAPLIFTLLGLAGSFALTRGYRRQGTVR